MLCNQKIICKFVVLEEVCAVVCTFCVDAYVYMYVWK